MNRLLATVGILVVLSLAGCSDKPFKDEFKEQNPVAKGGDVVERDIPPLSAAEVQIYLANTTLSHEGETRIWHVYLGDDGGLSGLSLSTQGGKERASGSWEVTEDGLLCRKWDNDWGGGETGCAKVYQYGNDFVFVPEGTERGGDELRRTRRPGDPFRVR